MCLFIYEKSIFLNERKGKQLKTCLKYSTRSSKWSYITSVCNTRSYAACTVFEGKIVMSGGVFRSHGDIKSVEAYNCHINKWTRLPDMKNKKASHETISMGNNMFVIGGDFFKTCEVFDSFSRTFIAIKEMHGIYKVSSLPLVGIRNKIFVFSKLFCYTMKSFHIYDVLTNTWNVKENYVLKIKYVISCSKPPVV